MPRCRSPPKGELKIHRIVAATDPGYVVNPDQVAAQVEGSFVYGLSAALYGEITIEKGRVVEGNFDTYQVMRLADMPKVETVIVPSGGFWGGVGEPTIAVAAPAVLNAIFAATGKRIRTLPLRPARPSHGMTGRPLSRRRRCCSPPRHPRRVRWHRASPHRALSSCSGCHGVAAPPAVLTGRRPG